MKPRSAALSIPDDVLSIVGGHRHHELGGAREGEPGAVRAAWRPGTSTFVSGNQWDAPFGWAPLEMIAVEGLRRYGFNADGDRISRDFLSLVRESYQRDGVIVEKYDVTARGTSTEAEIRYGYRTNKAGFGWTDAVFNRLTGELQDRR